MYRVYLRQIGQQEKACIHNPISPDTVIIDPIVKLKANTSGSFTFGVEQGHYQYENLHQLKSEVQVYRDDKWLFTGRILSIRSDFAGVKHITCEGVLSYLNDIIAPSELHHARSISTFLHDLVAIYNKKTTSDVRFKVGRMTVTGSMPDVVFTNYETVWDAISQLIKRFGGFLYVASQKDGEYTINYEETFIRRNNQVIAYGVNLLDSEIELNAIDLATVLIPLGAETDEAFTQPVADLQMEARKAEEEAAIAKRKLDEFDKVNEEELNEEQKKAVKEQQKRAKAEYDHAISRSKTAAEKAKNGLANEQGGTVVIKKRIDIKSVNGGKEYIVNDALYSRFGIIERVLDLPDIKDPFRLMQAAQEELKRIDWLAKTITVRVVDIGLADGDTPSFEAYHNTIVALPGNERMEMPITEMDIHLTAPDQDTVTLGAKIEGGMDLVSQKLASVAKASTQRTAQRVAAAEGSVASQIANEAHAIRATIDGVFAETSEKVEAEIKARDQAIKAELAPYSERMEQAEKDLDAVRADIIAKATALGDRASIIEARVTSAEGMIVSSTQKMDVLDGNVKAAAAEIKQVPSKITAAVSEVENRINAVNILLNSSFHTDASLWDTNLAKGSDLSFGLNMGYRYMRIINGNRPAMYVAQNVRQRITKLGMYTLSGWVSVETSQGAGEYMVFISVSQKKNNDYETVAHLRLADATGNKIGGGWQFFEIPVSISSLTDVSEIWVNIYTYNAVGTLYVRDFFMASGTTAINGEGLSDIVRRSAIDISPEGIVSTVGSVINGTTFATMIAQNDNDVAIIADKLKIKASMIVDGSITAQKIDVGAIDASKIAAGAITAEAITSKAAELNDLSSKLVMAQKAYIESLAAMQIKAASISADQISTGVLRSPKIENAIIKFGQYGHIVQTYAGININSPASKSDNYGVSMLLCGKPGGVQESTRDYPEGLWIYRNPNFSSYDAITPTDKYLLTVSGFIDAAGVKSLRFTDSGSGGHIGYYNSSNVSLFFGGSGNSIYYVWGSNVYDIYHAVRAYASDRRLKENIKKTSRSGLEYIKQFDFCEFDWNDLNKNPGKHTHIGLIAQDVQDIDDTLVYDNGGYLQLDGLKLINIALKATQELEEENRILKEKISAIEKRMAELERKVSKDEI